MSKSILKNTLLTSTVIASTMLFATQAFAQDAPPQEPAGSAEPGVAPKENSQEIEEAQAEAAADTSPDSDIVVTGTRITNPNLVQSSPVTVIGEGEIQLQQVSSVEELLHELPGQSPSINQNVNNGGGGAAFINLRGLGSNRNLVLLDGQRLVPVDLVARTDLNSIPPALIERVDIFTGGASTVYGADAVAGVVNFITKRNFSGVDVDLGTGISEKGDGALLRASATVGANFDDNRGNVVLSVGITETKPVYYAERSFSERSFGSGTGAEQGSTTGVPLRIRNGTVNQTQLDVATGLLVPAYNTYNFAPLNLLQTPLTRYNIYGKGRYEISDRVEAYASGMYTRSKVLFNAAPTAIFANNVFVPVSNPFLPVTLRNQLCGLVDSNAILAGVQTLTPAECTAAAAALTPNDPAYRELLLTAERRFTEKGPRVTNYNFNTFQGSVGLRGPLISNLKWDINGAYGESSRLQSSGGGGLLSSAQQALRATNPNTCTVTTGGCVPLNIFGAEGSITPAMLNFIDATTYNFVDTNLTQGAATVQGDFGFVMPWATQPVGVAAGVEYRRYWGFSRGDAISSQVGAVLGAGAAALPQQGDYNSREAFAEAIIPIIEDRPFFNSLTLEVGGRYAHYDLSGGNWTYKVGGSWEPIPDIKFRAMYAKAVRAPNLAELFQPQVVALTNLGTDPCQGTGLPAAMAALCVATGVPANIINTGLIPAPSAGQIQSTQGGNPLLAPEIAKSFTAGVVLQPRMVPGFALTLDYYNIDVEGAVSNPTVNDIISGCYGLGNPSLDPSNLFCQLVVRNSATGRLDGEPQTTPGLQLLTSNQGFLQVRGFDLTANYRRDVGFGRLSWAFNGNHTLRSRFKAIPSDLSPLRECNGFYSTSCSPPSARWGWSMRTTLGWLNNTVDTSLLWRHRGAMKVEPRTCTTDSTLSCGPTLDSVFDAYESIPAYDYFDFSNRVQATDNMSLVFTIFNLFNKQPPFVGSQIGTTAFNHANTFPSSYDPIGRAYRVGVNLRF